MNKLPETFFFCHGCGKISLTKEGFNPNTNTFNGEKGWDVSCMLNCSEIMTRTVHVLEILNRLEELQKKVGV